MLWNKQDPPVPETALNNVACVRINDGRVIKLENGKSRFVGLFNDVQWIITDQGPALRLGSEILGYPAARRKKPEVPQEFIHHILTLTAVIGNCGYPRACLHWIEVLRTLRGFMGDEIPVPDDGYAESTRLPTEQESPMIEGSLGPQGST